MNKKFVVDARTIIHLGRESIKDHTTALIELVKNSYDADATIVEIDILQNSEGGLIRVADDGEGMSEKIIDDNWLRIGYSSKTIEKTTSKGRRKTGEKGIGRLSADRLGRILTLKSRSVEGDIGIEIDWEKFNNPKANLSDIEVIVLEENDLSIKIPREKKTGTELIIKDLRNKWAPANIADLVEELSILRSPFSSSKDFKIIVNNNINSDFNGEVLSPDFIKPEIKLNLQYDGSSDSIEVKIEDIFNPDNIFCRTYHWKELSQTLKEPADLPYSSDFLECGPVSIELRLYPRNKELADLANFSLTELRKFINKNVGVKIYRDNISVKPYGYTTSQNGSDWLGIGERHSRNPAGVNRESYRVVANQLVGAIFIARDKNKFILDSASREGLVENTAFFDLKALVLSALSLLEAHRYNIYQQRRKEKVGKPTLDETAFNFKDAVDSTKEKLKTLNDLASSLKEGSEKSLSQYYSLIKDFYNNIEVFEIASSSFNDLLDHNRILASLASIGISSSVFGHETQTAINQFRGSTEVAKLYLEASNPKIKDAREELRKAIISSKLIEAWGKFALSRVNRDKRKRRKHNIKDIIIRLLLEFQQIFYATQITFETDKLVDIEAYVFPMDIESIVINLLTNAYTACIQGTDTTRIISLRTQYKKQKNIEGYSIDVANTGTPIDEKIRDWIWEPLATQRKGIKGNLDGTGLGLPIIKSIVEKLKGDRFVTTDEELGGALFSIWLPIR